MWALLSSPFIKPHFNIVLLTQSQCPIFNYSLTNISCFWETGIQRDSDKKWTCWLTFKTSVFFGLNIARWLTPEPIISGDTEDWNLNCKSFQKPVLFLTASVSNLHMSQNIYFPLSLSPVYSQPIISKAGADLLRTHFLPTLDKLKKKTVKVRTWNLLYGVLTAAHFIHLADSIISC